MLLSTLLADEAEWYPVLFDSPLNIARGIAFWLTIALALAFAVCALVLRGETRKKFLRFFLPAAALYACAVGLILLILTFLEDGINVILFVPLLVLLAAVAGSAAAIAVKPCRLTFLIGGCATGAALIAVLVCMGINFSTGAPAGNNGIVDENGDPDNSLVNSLGLYLSAAAAVAAVIAAAFLLGRKDKRGFDSRSLTTAGVCIAMSFALSYLRIVKMPQGGSITVASLLPLMIYSYMYGTRKGVFAGFIYGVLQAFQDFYILHPAQFILDYPAAFACIGLAGMFADVKALKHLPQVKFALGAVVAGLGRFLMHFLSGIFAFGSYAPAGTPVWLYSLGYQAGYVLPDIAIAIAAGVFVFSSRAFNKAIERFRPAEKPAAADAPTDAAA